MHEIGHVVGLGHIYDDPNPTVMADNRQPNNFLFALTSDDKEALSQVCELNGTPVGVKDYINVTSDLDHFDVNYLYVGHLNVNFVDVDGDENDDYPINWDNLQIKASYGCGDVLVYNAQGVDFEIPSLPNGYNWERDANGYVIGSLTAGGTDNDGYHHTATIPIKIGNVPNTFITSGTLTSDTTYWCGNITLTGSITVPSGSVLNVDPGAVIKFPSDASLIVNGKLDAMGCTFEPVSGTTANSWGSIQLNGSGASGSSIEYANIYYGNEVQVINVPNFIISNSSFLNNYISIYVSGSTGSILNNNLNSNSIGHSIQLANSTVTCNYNVIQKNGSGARRGHGILFGGGSNGNMWQNDIYDVDWGVAAIWSSSPDFYKSNWNLSQGMRNNRITNCNYGVMVYRNSFPVLGEPANGYGSSTIENNSVDVDLNYYTNYNSSYADACGIYWNNGNPANAVLHIGSGSHLYTSPYATSDNWASYPLPKIMTPGTIKNKTTEVAADVKLNSNTVGDSSSEINNGGISDSLYTGIDLRHQNKLKEARDYFLTYLSKHPDNQRAYVELYDCADSETRPGIIKFFESLPKQASNEQKLLLNYLYQKEGNFAAAKGVNDAIIKDNLNSQLSTRADIENLYIALYDENNLDNAVSTYKDVLNKSALSTSLELSDAEYAIESYARIHNKTVPNLSTLKKQLAIAINQPEDYGLLGNYPNPFNPTTTISYTLPRTSEVELDIYDILGNKIKSFTIPSQSAGRQGIVWNGTNSNNEPVASGIYLYHFKVVSLEGDNEAFEKTAKLLLLK